MKISNVEAILSLNPNAELKCNNDDIDSIKWLNGTKEIPKDEILAEVKRLQADYDAKQYQRDRKLEYPSIEELVVALYDEEDKASIIERRKAVKAKYPKPE